MIHSNSLSHDKRILSSQFCFSFFPSFEFWILNFDIVLQLSSNFVPSLRFALPFQIPLLSLSIIILCYYFCFLIESRFQIVFWWSLLYYQSIPYIYYSSYLTFSTIFKFGINLASIRQNHSSIQRDSFCRDEIALFELYFFCSPIKFYSMTQLSKSILHSSFSPSPFSNSFMGFKLFNCIRHQKLKINEIFILRVKAMLQGLGYTI